jgi:hypothetical protein
VPATNMTLTVVTDRPMKEAAVRADLQRHIEIFIKSNREIGRRSLLIEPIPLVLFLKQERLFEFIKYVRRSLRFR